MKKSFVITLALVFVLGITTAAFANPFTDVPTNHWAYASVSKLAKAGIIDGYGDGRFIGNSNMTRYEMAQIVAKAMAHSDKADAALKAQIDKLASEFAKELKALGLRVATLEKKTDNVKITGEVRFSNYSYSDLKLGGQVLDPNMAGTNDLSALRTRLWLTGNVNDNWNYVGMIENTQNLQTNNQETNTEFKRAYVEGKIGTIGVKAGRFDYTPLYGTVLDDDSDGLALNYNKGKFSMDIFAIRPNTTNAWYSTYNALTNPDALQRNTQTYGAQINYNFTDKLHAGIVYYDVKGVGAEVPANDKVNTSIIEAGVDYKFSNLLNGWANYIRGGKAPGAPLEFDGLAVDIGSKNGWATGFNFGNLDRQIPKTYQLRASYYSVPALGSISTTLEFSNLANVGVGFKGYVLGASCVLAKNVDLNLDYYNFKSKATIAGDNAKSSLLWSYVRFYF